MESSSKEGGSPALSALFTLLGLCALGLTVTGNAWFGMSLAQSEEAQYWQGGSAVYIDTMVAALAGACGWLYARGRIATSILLGVLAIIFAAASALSLVGLGAMERIAKAQAIEVAQQSAKEAAEDRNVFAAGAHERNLSWLRQQAQDKSLSRSERRELREELRRETASGPAISERGVTATMSDPQAEFVAKRTGWDVASVQMVFVSGLAILLIIGKTVSFWLSGYLSRSKMITAQPLIIDNTQQASPLSIVSNDVNGLHDEREGSGTVDNSVGAAPEKEASVKHWHSSTTGDTEVAGIINAQEDDTEHEARRLQSGIRETIGRHVIDEAVVDRFLDEQTQRHPGGNTSAHRLYAAYVLYAQKNNYSVLTQNQFGRLLSAAGLQRVSSRRGVDYLNLVLVDEGGAREAPQALAA